MYNYILQYFINPIYFLIVNFYNKYIRSNAKIAVITAIYGNYESTCKKFKNQTVKTDFICFTDNPNIKSNGWIIDNKPYHLINKCVFDNDKYNNSIINNKHTFNIAKYYKQHFQNIDRLNKYDVIIWIDGTIEITNGNMSDWILQNIHKYKIIGWEHEMRNGILENEVNASNFYRYTSTFWYNQTQTFQDVFKQYEEYINDGYDETFFKKIDKLDRVNFGVWLTCFVAFDNKNIDVRNFLNLWYNQTLKYTTQDQISFPYVCQKINLIPYTLPDKEINGSNPHNETDFYIKHNHGK